LQSLISETLSNERKRLGVLLTEMLDDSAKTALQQLLVRDDTLSGLAALKQDAKQHLEYDSELKTLTWHKYKASNDKALQESFYSKLGFCKVADVLRFVN
jgi:hypothetical protein